MAARHWTCWGVRSARGEGHGVPCPGAARGVASGRPPAARLVQAALAARAAADRRQPGDRGGPDHRRALGRRSGFGPPQRAVGARLQAARRARARPRAAGRGRSAGDETSRLCRQRRHRPARLDPFRAPGPGRSRTARRRPGRRRPGPRRSARLVAGSALRGLHVRIVRAGRNPPARRAAPGDGRAEDRCRPAPWPGQRAGRRAAGSRPPASVPRALHRPAHAGTPPLGPPGRSAAVLRPPAVHARRRTRARSLHRAPGARAPDPDVGPGAGPADAGECRRPAVGHPGLRAKGADRDERPGADVSRLSGGGGTRGQHHGRAAGACQRRRVHPADADRSGGDGQPDPSEHPHGRGLLARSGRCLRRHARVRRRHAGRGGEHRIALLRCGHIGRGRRRRRARRRARSWLRPRPGGPGVRPRGGRARLRARLRLRAGVAAGDRRPACARRGAVKLGHAAARCRGGVRRHVEPVQGVGGVRRGGRRRLLRPRARRRAPARPAGHHRERRTVCRRRGTERQWQVERGEGRAAAGHSPGCSARFRRVVRRPDGPQPAALRRAGRRAAHDRRRSQD